MFLEFCERSKDKSLQVITDSSATVLGRNALNSKVRRHLLGNGLKSIENSSQIHTNAQSQPNVLQQLRESELVIGFAYSKKYNGQNCSIQATVHNLTGRTIRVVFTTRIWCKLFSVHELWQLRCDVSCLSVCYPAHFHPKMDRPAGCLRL